MNLFYIFTLLNAILGKDVEIISTNLSFAFQLLFFLFFTIQNNVEFFLF